MARALSTIDAGHALRSSLVVRIKLARTFRLRLWLAIQLIGLAARVCPLTVKLDKP